MAPEIAKTIIYLVDDTQSRANEFRIGAPTNLLYDPTGEYYKADLMNYSLGGNFNNRVNLNLPRQRDGPYGARTSITGDKYSGDFLFSASIKASATDSALTEIMKEMNLYVKKDQGRRTQLPENALGQRDALLYETGNQKRDSSGVYWNITCQLCGHSK